MRDSRKSRSYVTPADNPFLTGEDLEISQFLQKLKMESISENSASTISHSASVDEIDFVTLLKAIEVAEDNETRLHLLEEKKHHILFTSAQLIKLLLTTESVKTRLKIVAMVSPRLTDPSAMSSEIDDLFRFSDEKQQVEEALKARSQTLNAKKFIDTNSMLSSGSGSRGGGRGGGGRGRGGGGRGR